MKKLFFILILLVANHVYSQIQNDVKIEDVSFSVRDTTFIHPLSEVPLFLEAWKTIRGKEIKTSTATGFIYEKNNKLYLITNWHVVKGRNNIDSSSFKMRYRNEIGLNIEVDVAEPEFLIVYFHKKTLGNWLPIRLPLYNEDGTEKWLEHPQKRKIDVVAIELEPSEAVKEVLAFYSINKHETTYDEELIFFPSMNVSVLGFPEGFVTSGKFPIWKTGQIASDYDIDINNLPLFYIDAATRGGMSGSPVIYLSDNYITREGRKFGRIVQKFMGVYSGRLPFDSDIGLVWKASCLDEIIK